MNTVPKIILFLFCFLWLVFTCEGKKVPGYIVTEDRDTLYGNIYIYRFNLNTGLFFINGIDDESYHYQVAFKNKQDKKYKVFKPEDVQGFGFRFKNEDYVYQKFQIIKRSLVPEEKLKVRFLRLVYSNGFSLYQDRNRIRQASGNLNKSIPGSSFGEESMVVTDYYLYSAAIGLKRVDGSIPVTELLMVYGMDAAFIKALPDQVKSRDVPEIIAAYEVWRIGKQSLSD